MQLRHHIPLGHVFTAARLFTLLLSPFYQYLSIVDVSPLPISSQCCFPTARVSPFSSLPIDHVSSITHVSLLPISHLPAPNAHISQMTWSTIYLFLPFAPFSQGHTFCSLSAHYSTLLSFCPPKLFPR
jgi:hypothetical protein